MTTLGLFSEFGRDISSIIDKGSEVPVQTIEDIIQEGSLFIWLETNFQGMIDFNKYHESERDFVIKHFTSNVEEALSRRMNISNNGLCLLVSYCFDAITFYNRTHT